MTLQLHRPDGEGGLEPRPVEPKDWHSELQSPRWGTTLKGDALPKLKNTEMDPTSTARSLLRGDVGVDAIALVAGRGRSHRTQAWLAGAAVFIAVAVATSTLTGPPRATQISRSWGFAASTASVTWI